MRKNYTLIFALILIYGRIDAAHFTIVPTGNLTYSPMTTNASVGDTVTITASGTHPAVEVSQSTWNANGNAPLSGGFGFHSTTFNITLTTVGTIYFVCNNHNSSGMKGQIVVTASGVSELSANNLVKILANPSTNGQLQVMNTLGKIGTLYIFNMLGKLQSTNLLQSDATQLIDINLPNGNYLCRFVMEGNWTHTEKLVVTEGAN